MSRIRQHTIHKVAFIKKRSLSGELVVVLASLSGIVKTPSSYFRRKEFLQRVGIVVSYID